MKTSISRRQLLASAGALALAACATPTVAPAPTTIPATVLPPTQVPATALPAAATAAPTSVPATAIPTIAPTAISTANHTAHTSTATALPTSAPAATRAPEPTTAPAPTKAPEPTKAPAAPTAPPRPPAGGSFKAEITLFSFKPFVIEVPAGTTVTWTNNDLIEHSVTSGLPEKPDGLFNSGFFTRGKTYSQVFDKPGKFPYYCMRHTSMTGEVVVK